MDGVIFDIEAGSAVCDEACSFLIVEPNVTLVGPFLVAGLAAETSYTVVWVNQGADEFPIVVLSDGDEEFLDRAMAVVDSAEVGQLPVASE